jgi:hypothetical protein
MRFMLLQYYAEPGSGAPILYEWAPEDIQAHIAFQVALNDELTRAGEFVDAQGLTGPEVAKSVTWNGKGAPVVTDGPYPESKELIAGYRMIEVDSLERALEIAAKAAAAPGPNGVPLEDHIEVREVMGAPATDD